MNFMRKSHIITVFSKEDYVLTEGDVSRHAEGDCLGQWCGLCEEVQVVESKDQLDRFIHLNGNLNAKGE